MAAPKKYTAGILAAIATLLLHTLFITAAIWGGSGQSQHPKRPESIGSGANSGRTEGDLTERRIVAQLLSTVAADRSKPDAHLSELLSLTKKLEIIGPDTIPLPPLVSAREGITANSFDAELMARAKMIGIYESQTRARIERAWALPEGFADESFNCRALIRQHQDGRVIEVELPHGECDDSPQMRQSLVNAIFTASPLPAPPHPGVFVDGLSLVLRSESVRRQ